MVQPGQYIGVTSMLGKADVQTLPQMEPWRGPRHQAAAKQIELIDLGEKIFITKDAVQNVVFHDSNDRTLSGCECQPRRTLVQSRWAWRIEALKFQTNFIYYSLRFLQLLFVFCLVFTPMWSNRYPVGSIFLILKILCKTKTLLKSVTCTFLWNDYTYWHEMYWTDWNRKTEVYNGSHLSTLSLTIRSYYIQKVVLIFFLRHIYT